MARYYETPDVDREREPSVQGVCKDCGNGTLNNELNPDFESWGTMTFARIENWTLAGGRLHGNVYGHLQFDDGEFVHTSVVINFDKLVGVATTRNTGYVLGKPWVSPEHTP